MKQRQRLIFKNVGHATVATASAHIIGAYDMVITNITLLQQGLSTSELCKFKCMC